MKFSIKWLNEFVGTNNISKEDFIKSMAKIGFNIKNFKIQGENLKNIVVGRILFIDEHPYADRLSVCSVHVGKDKPVQIVTNATNIKAGNLVPVALDGAVLADNTTITAGKIRDILSVGMFCSIKELGVDRKDYPFASEDEVFILDNNCTIGQDIKEALGFNDTTFEINIPNKRSDCNCVIGLAREISAKFDKLLRIRSPKVDNSSSNASELLNISNEALDVCPYYCAAVVKNIKLGQSPKWIQERLVNSNIKPVNNIVDITNYVMLEYGQPINVFDYRTIENGSLKVRYAKPNETITTLDGITRTLTEDNVVLADESKILSIPGIARGEFGCLTSNSTTVVFEASNLDKDYINSISKKLSLSSDQSTRFESGLDSNYCIPALKRVCELIQMLNIGEFVGPIIESNFNLLKPTKIEFDYDKINSFLNSSFSLEEMQRILKKIGCTFENEHILVVPSYRHDLNNIYDIAGEIVRFYGYDNINASSLKRLPFQGACYRYKKFEEIKRIVSSLGLNEILTSPVIDRLDINKTDFPNDRLISINQDGNKILRPSVLISSLNYIANSPKEKLEFFELGNKYSLDDDNNIIEKAELSCGLFGDNYDFYDIKGILEELMDNIKVKDYHIEENSENLTFHPGVSAVIKIKDKNIGFLGELNPQVVSNYNIKHNVYLLNLELDKII